MPNKSLDPSGGSVFRNLLGAAEGALIRPVEISRGQLKRSTLHSSHAIGCTNEKSLSIMDIGFRHLQRGSFVSRIFARATNNQKTAWSEVSAARNKGTIRFGQ